MRAHVSDEIKGFPASWVRTHKGQQALVGPRVCLQVLLRHEELRAASLLAVELGHLFTRNPGVDFQNRGFVGVFSWPQLVLPEEKVMPFERAKSKKKKES